LTEYGAGAHTACEVINACMHAAGIRICYMVYTMICSAKIHLLPVAVLTLLYLGGYGCEELIQQDVHDEHIKTLKINHLES
jgi:hypothetical protein